MNIISLSGSQFRDGADRFRFIGGNNYGLLYTTNPAGQDDTALKAFFSGCKRDGIRVVRCWLYNEPGRSPFSDTGGNFWYWSGTQILYRESQFQAMDRTLYWAAQYGIRIYPSFSDWATGAMFARYFQVNDTRYGTHYQNGQTISISLTRSGNLVTAVTSVPHELYANDPVGTYCLFQIINAVDSSFNTNGAHPLTIVDANTFTFTQGGSDAVTTGQLKRGDSFYSPMTQAFFHVPTIKQMFKDYITYVTNRISTVDGITYKNHPAIFGWECGNELRYGQTNETNVNGNNSNNVLAIKGWTSEISAHIKSQDPNHLIGFGDCAHRSGFVTNDQAFNGSYYGGDPDALATIPTLDFIDVHVYAWQWDNNQFRSNPGWYGVAEGWGQTARGLKMAMQHYIKSAKAAGKACIVGEWGCIKQTVSNDRYVNYPREFFFAKAMDEWFEDDGDGFIMWHYYPTNSQGQFDDNYGIKAEGWYSQLTDLPGRNDNDNRLLSWTTQKNNLFLGKKTTLGNIQAGSPMPRGV